MFSYISGGLVGTLRALKHIWPDKRRYDFTRIPVVNRDFYFAWPQLKKPYVPILYMKRNLARGCLVRGGK